MADSFTCEGCAYGNWGRCSAYARGQYAARPRCGGFYKVEREDTATQKKINRVLFEIAADMSATPVEVLRRAIRIVRMVQ